MVPYQNGVLLFEISTDIVYTYTPKLNEPQPFLINRTSLDNYNVIMGIVTERYCFMDAMEKSFDFSTGQGFSTTHLMYDRQEGRTFRTTVLNNDFESKKSVSMTAAPLNAEEVAGFVTLQAYELTEARDNDDLRGSLKTAVAKLDEEDNIVVMVMKYKKP